ncbi:MAG: nucleoside triphosphate pyrophosphohydrolase [Acidobacteria bacterium]|nr:nucleoside triphosphate pyrophosphohydrolase [Acidobacteriota bacterium]
MASSLENLLSIMDRLRGPDGCPWDREQTLKDLRVFLLEETHEVLDAMDKNEPGPLKEELGDLLFQIIFQSRIATEMGWFDFGQVAEAIAEKLIRRHPHVFGDARLTSSGEVIEQWEDLKEAERRKAALPSRLGGVPSRLPALLRALRLSEKAARTGFDWSTPADVFDKVREEIEEWEAATKQGAAAAARRELGDLLFSLVNVARKLGVDPEAALQETNDEFQRRFAAMERMLAESGEKSESLTAQRWDELWRRAKASATAS